MVDVTWVERVNLFHQGKQDSDELCLPHVKRDDIPQAIRMLLTFYAYEDEVRFRIVPLPIKE